MRSRSGKVTGRASAAASETAPRSPAQLTTKVSRVASPGSRAAITRRGEPGSRLEANTRTIRPTTTTPLTANREAEESWLGDRLPRLSRMCGSSNPISTKTKPLSTSPMIFQVVSHRIRLLGVRIVPRRPPMTRPAVTAASTPDSPSLSAREIGRERDHDGDQDLDPGGSSEDAEGSRRDPTDDEADGDPADPGDDEPRQRLGQEKPAPTATTAAR